MPTSWPDRIHEHLAGEPIAPGVIAIYVFGSATRDEDAHDLDILLIYDRAELPPEEAQVVGPTLAARLATIDRPVHLTALTVEEERNVEFAATEQAVSVWP
jgi:predicted nucleotidyltransferase